MFLENGVATGGDRGGQVTDVGQNRGTPLGKCIGTTADRSFTLQEPFRGRRRKTGGRGAEEGADKSTVIGGTEVNQVELLRSSCGSG